MEAMVAGVSESRKPDGWSIGRGTHVELPLRIFKDLKDFKDFQRSSRIFVNLEDLQETQSTS